MKLQKPPAKKKYIIPKYKGYFYRCSCGNHLTGFKRQAQCDTCGAWFDWDKVTEVEEYKK